MGKIMLGVGQRIPAFRIDAYINGKIRKISNSDFRNKWLVVIFYPADFTFVCPTELEELANDYDKFVSLKAEILSISMDSVQDHKKWHETDPRITKVRYPMGADQDGKLYDLFGINRQKSPRATFIFNPKGVLTALEIHESTIGRNTREIIRKLEAYRHVETHPDENCPANWEPKKPAINVKKASAEIRRIKTGIISLDEKLQGGIEKNRIFLVAGESGTGKTVFGMQFIYEGLKNGENAVYVTSHEKPDAIVNDAKSFGWKFDEYINDKKLVIMDASEYSIKARRGKKHGIAGFITDLSKNINRINAKRAVIDDTIDYIIGNPKKREIDMEGDVRKIVQNLENNGCTSIITSGTQSKPEGLSRTGMEERMATGVIILEMGKSASNRRIYIKKMRGTYIGLPSHGYYIDGKKGFVMSARTFER